jgi:HD superfamily phosphodiesterase
MDMNGTLMNTLDADRRRALENVREAAARIWSRPLHRYYTDHTVDHSERVIALLDGLTAGMMDTDKRLSSTEIFVLLAAAYLHDIGMQDERFADGDLEAIRDAHHKVTAELVYRAAEDPAQAVNLGLPDDPGLVEAVALVAKGHRRVDLSAAEYEPFVHGGEMVRLRLLAALLRFGDELDIDHRRVDLEQMKLLDLPLESQLHWSKCHYVSGVSIADEYIRVSYRFPQDRPDYEGLIVPLVEGEVRARHAALEEVFRAHAVKVALGPPQVRLMRLVQPLPPEVEALARQKLEAADEAVVPLSSPAAPLGSPAGQAPSPPSAPSASTAVPGKREQTVESQTGGATYHVHIERATGIAIGDKARVESFSDDRLPPGKETAQEDTFAPKDERAALQRELAQHKRNLYKLREQAAIYTAGETPLHLLNQIEAEEKEIRRIEGELENLGD